jgi:hypothetical protein
MRFGHPHSDHAVDQGTRLDLGTSTITFVSPVRSTPTRRRRVVSAGRHSRGHILVVDVDSGLPDPAAAVGCGTGGEPAGHVQPVHDRSDMAANRRRADPGTAGDCVVVQAFRH